MPQRRQIPGDSPFVGPPQVGGGGPGFVGPPQVGGGNPAAALPGVGGGPISGSPLGGSPSDALVGSSPGFVGPPQVGPPNQFGGGGGDDFLGPPSITPAPGPVGPPSVGGGQFTGPPSITPAPGPVGPPSISPGGGQFTGPPSITPAGGGKFSGPPQIQPMGGPRPLASAPPGANAAVNQAAFEPETPPPGGTPDFNVGGPNIPSPEPQPQAPTSNVEGTTSQELIQKHMPGAPPALVQEMLKMQEAALQRAQQEQQRGPIEPGDQTKNPVGYARLYRQYIKKGMAPAQAAARANAEMAPGKRDRQGRLRYDVVERNKDEFNQPQYLQKVLGNKNFVARFGGGTTPGAPPDTGNRFVGPAEGGQPGNIPPSNGQGEPAPFPNQGPINAVGQDPLSESINEGLFNALGSGGGATTEFGESVEGSLLDTLGRAGQLNQGVVDQRLETAQEGLDRLEQNRNKNLRASLASRGLLGQGAEFSGMEDITRDIASIGAGQFRDIYATEQEAADRRFQDTLGLGTGYAAQQPGNLVNSINAGTGRQTALAQVALQNLSQQQDFNMFLAEFGLERDKTLAQIEQGRIDSLVPLLQLFYGGAGQARQGFL